MSKFTSSLQREELSVEIENSLDTEEIGESALSEIKLTTYVGSKGLSGGQVFIVGLEEGEFPRQNPTFDEGSLDATKPKIWLVCVIMGSPSTIKFHCFNQDSKVFILIKVGP